MHMPIEQVRKYIIKALAQPHETVWSHKYGDDSLEWEDFDKYDDYAFYIKDNKLHVIFIPYEITDGKGYNIDVELPDFVVDATHNYLEE